MEVVADMVEVMLTATQVVVDMAVAATVVEPVEIACLTSELDFRNRTGVS
jgi:hypothetical protein